MLDYLPTPGPFFFLFAMKPGVWGEFLIFTGP